MKWFREIGKDIIKDVIIKMFIIFGCVYVEDNIVFFVYDILIIVLFKLVVEVDEYLLWVVENCDVDVMF